MKEVAASVIEAAAADIALPRHWCTGNFEQTAIDPKTGSPVVQKCLVGAIWWAEAEIANTTDLLTRHLINPHDLDNFILERLASEVPASDVTLQYSDPQDILVSYNDTVVKDKRYVIRLFKRVAKQLRKEVQ